MRHRISGMAALLGLWITACSSSGPGKGQGGGGGHGGEGHFGPGGAGVIGGGGETTGSAGGASTTGATTSPSTTRGGAGGGGPFMLDPGQFDCSASKAPERVNAIPLACATDPACTARLVSGYRAAGDVLGETAPSGTLSAVRAAIVMGLDYVHTDPRITKDEVVVNSHSLDLSTTTNGAGMVGDLTLAQIQAFTVVAKDVQGDPLPGDFSCEKVPTLAQVLETAKDKVAVLVDGDTNARVDLTVAAIQEAGMLEQAIFESASLAKLDEAIALEPALMVSVRVLSKGELQTALDHLASHPPALVQIADGGSPVVLTPAIHAAGHRALYNVFGADTSAALSGEKDAYDKAIAWDIDVLQSGRPDLALAPLDRWPPPPQP